MNSNSTYAYHVLKASLTHKQCMPNELNELDAAKVRKIAGETLALESAVLNSEKAANVHVPASMVDDSVSELEARYPSREAFLDELEANHIDTMILREAIERQLKVDATLEEVSMGLPDPTDDEIAEFYEKNIGRFTLPETREARHILMTINPDFLENTRENAFARMSELEKQIKEKGVSFETLASRHSECPTALQGGTLGRVKPGQLYDEIDQTLFSLAEGHCSGIIETEAGFHLVHCEKIHGARSLELKEVSFRISEHLHKKLKERVQQSWMANILRDERLKRQSEKNAGQGDIKSFVTQGVGG